MVDVPVPDGLPDRSPDRIAVLVNPTAGRGRGARLGTRVIAALRAAGLPASLLVGRDGAHALELARTAVSAGARCLVVVGGDGMVHLGTRVLAGTETPLVVAPAGTGNDFARALGLPLRDDVAATRATVAALTRGTTRHVDAVRAGSSWYACALSAGLDSRVNARANAMRHPAGRLRYDVALLRELPAFEPVPFTIELAATTGEPGDGAPRRLHVEATLVAVANTPSYGGGMRICPTAEIDDGVLDVTVVGAVSIPTLLRLFPRVFTGRHVEHPAVTTYRARRVSLAAHGIDAYADGERLAALPLTVEVVPAALRVIVPPDLGVASMP